MSDTQLDLLILDENEDARVLLCDLLERNGYACKSVEGVDEALPVIATRSPRALLVKWFSAGGHLLDSLKMLRDEARKVSPGARLIIVSTTTAPSGFPSVDAYLVKPARLDDIVRAIEA